MNAGKLNTKATIQKPVRADDSFGSVGVTWQGVGSTWIEILDSKSREFVQVAQSQAETTHVIRTRFQRGITSENRLTYNDAGTTRTLNILGVVNTGNANKELMIAAVEVANG